MLDKEERKIERLIITVFFSYKEQLRSNVNDREKLKLCDESYNDNHSIGWKKRRGLEKYGFLACWVDIAKLEANIFHLNVAIYFYNRQITKVSLP